MAVIYPNTNTCRPAQISPSQSYQITSLKPQPVNQTDSFQSQINQGLKQGRHSLRHHWLNILLMGASTLLFPIFPKPLKMPLKHALTMAPVHMAFMGAINFSISFVKGFRAHPNLETDNRYLRTGLSRLPDPSKSNHPK